MLTIGEVAAMVSEWFFVQGHPHAYTFMEHIADEMEVLKLEPTTPLKYQGEGKAYCKYCWQTHDEWILSNEHFPPAWTCQQCNHTTRDDFMEIK